MPAMIKQNKNSNPNSGESLTNGKSSDKPFLSALNGKAQKRPPFWFMRQAGRYLPEYRKIRSQAGTFLDMVYNPALAAEVTLQPLRRFHMDAAIIFSDILVIPKALGRDLAFVEGEGPVLNPLKTKEEIDGLKQSLATGILKLGPVYEAISLTRDLLEEEAFNRAALIGFAGAPWTLACYMVDGRGGGRGFPEALRMMRKEEALFSQLIEILTEAVSQHCCAQIAAGAEAIQLFDSWAGLLDDVEFERWSTNPAKRIVQTVRACHPSIPVIGFPRGAGKKGPAYARETGINALSVDENAPRKWILDNLPPSVAFQGNLGPQALLAGGDVLRDETMKILKECTQPQCAHPAENTADRRPFIFNLGHGVIKETPPENVAALADMIRQFSA